MSDLLQVFDNPEFGSVRSLIIDGEPYFVGKDVAIALGYSNPRDALSRHVDDEDKSMSIINTPGGNQSLVVINACGLHSLFFSSEMSSAKSIKRWITTEVFPAIKKSDSYVIDNFIEELISDPDYAIKILTELKEKREKKNTNNTKLKFNSSDFIIDLKHQDSQMEIFYPDLIHEIKDKYKKIDNYLGYFYIVEYNNHVKIGSSRNLYQRYLTLKRECEKYNNGNIGRMAISKIAHTNYKENESYLHNYFSKNRINNTELFNLLFDDAISQIELLNIIYEDKRELFHEEEKVILNIFKQYMMTGNFGPVAFSN